MKRTALFCALLLTGCRLLQHTDLSGFDPATRTLFIHNFTNDTFQADVNVELTDWVRNEIGRRGNFRIVKTREEARFWLYGSIVAFSQQGQMYDNMQNPVRYEMATTVKIKFRENPVKSTSDQKVDKSGEITSSIQYSSLEGYIEQEFAARQRLLRGLAAKVSDAIEAEYLQWDQGGNVWTK
jgi:uncharacterized protein YPO0396